MHRSIAIISPTLISSVMFQMAEVAVPRELFRLILERIRRLRLPKAVSG
jgi:hypothetical protein